MFVGVLFIFFSELSCFRFSLSLDKILLNKLLLLVLFRNFVLKEWVNVLVIIEFLCVDVVILDRVVEDFFMECVFIIVELKNFLFKLLEVLVFKNLFEVFCICV